MLLTERQLRKTIRKLILENKYRDNMDKVVTLILSENIASITQALELAETLGYIGGYTYEEETHYASRSHGWTISEWDEEFFSVLSDRIKEVTLFRRPGGAGISFVSPWDLGAGGSASIRLIELPPFE